MASDYDSSSCSSGDELLNFTILSQPSPAKSEEKDETVELTVTKNNPSRKQDNELEDSKPAAVDEARALSTANSVIIDKQLESPSSLYWHIAKKKKKTTIYPVRTPPDESEYIGYMKVLAPKLKTGDKVVVQYIQFPHVEIKSNDVGLYDAVARSQLLPYHGNSNTKNTWCPQLSEQYFKQRRQQHRKFGEQQTKVEQFYLERILQKAKEEEANKAELEQYNDLAEEDDEYKIDDSKKPAVTAQEDEFEEEDTTAGKRRSKRRRSNEEQNHDWLRVGDVIQFYKPTTTAQVSDNLRQAKIMAIFPKKDPALVVDCPGEMFIQIPNDHHVMRLKRIERGSLVDCVGKDYWPVETFTMKREGNKDAAREVVNKRVGAVREITDRHRREAIERIEQDGCGPTDALRRRSDIRS